jgi:hypothetical protein
MTGLTDNDARVSELTTFERSQTHTHGMGWSTSGSDS